jgi:hypothetical protein
MRCFTRVSILLLVPAVAVPAVLHAQTTEPAADSSENGPVISDSNVGYIDSAIPASQFRLRFDAAYDNVRPNRAEFFYARGAPIGPGVPRPETSIDYQDISAYLELAVNRCVSGFVEFPVRFLNPEMNDNTAGFSDMNAGFKWMLLECDDLLLTFQFRTYIPTGDASRGLGADHASLEPALLLYKPLTDRLSLEAEFRDWIPVEGTEEFAGNVIRYGVGVGYDWLHTCNCTVRPVAEFVGWTVLDGQVTIFDPPAPVRVEEADGDTIVNVKVGVRVGIGCNRQLYAGYGRALTGDTWYDDIWRLELRLFF